MIGASNKETLVLDSIRKEVSEKFAETDSLFIGPNEYPKSTLLLALDAKNPTLMTLLVDPATQRISKKPEEEKLLLLYLGENDGNGETQGQGANPTPVDYTIKALEKEVSLLGPEEKFYLGGSEYSKDELLLALSGKDPLIMKYLVIPASKSFFEKEEYKELLLGYLQNQNKKSSPRNIRLGNAKPQKTCLLINPRFDPASNISYAWSVALIPPLKSMGWDVITIGNRPVRRSEVERAIEERNPELIIFYDHGGWDTLWGSKEPKEAVFSMENARLFKDREVYTSACLSGLILGKEAMRMGCKAYWGAIIPVICATGTPRRAMMWEWAFEHHQNDGILEKIMTPQLSWGDAFVHTYAVGDNLVKFLLDGGAPLEAFSILSNNNAIRVYTKEEKR